MPKTSSRTVDKIHRMVDEFLAVRVASDGGSWPEVSDKDFNALYELFQAIVDAKFERDCDGDSVINFAVVNRTEHMPIHHFPVGYPHKAKSMKELLRIADLQQGSVSGAAENLRHTLYCMKAAIDEAEKKGMTPDKYLAVSSR